MISSHARQGALNCRSSLTIGFWRELRRCAVPSAIVPAFRTASDAFTRPINNGAHPSGQHKCCSKTSLTFLSDAALFFAASCRSLDGNDHLSAIFTPGRQKAALYA
ncbi:hypothetical protein C5E25_09000 [Pectobacterium parmentieri]|nr:hypothetical protein C5E25_09000 [Pectobacterium parmentieri]RKO79783.1 hypothetical protein C5E04_10710 [Pectobacterium parmentieri]